MKNGWITSEKQTTVAHQRHLTQYMKSRPQSSNITSNKKKQMIAMKQSIEVGANNMVWNYENSANRLANGIGSLNLSS